MKYLKFSIKPVFGDYEVTEQTLFCPIKSMRVSKDGRVKMITLIHCPIYVGGFEGSPIEASVRVTTDKEASLYCRWDEVDIYGHNFTNVIVESVEIVDFPETL